LGNDNIVQFIKPALDGHLLAMVVIEEILEVIPFGFVNRHRGVIRVESTGASIVCPVTDKDCAVVLSRRSVADIRKESLGLGYLKSVH
jgi:hypothetical protein